MYSLHRIPGFPHYRAHSCLRNILDYKSERGGSNGFAGRGAPFVSSLRPLVHVLVAISERPGRGGFEKRWNLHLYMATRKSVVLKLLATTRLRWVGIVVERIRTVCSSSPGLKEVVEHRQTHGMILYNTILSILCATHSGTSLGHIVLCFRCTILGIFGYTDQKSGEYTDGIKTTNSRQPMDDQNRRLDIDATNETEPIARRRQKRPSWHLSRRNEKEQLLLPTNASIGRSESSNNNNKQEQTPTKLTATRTMKIPLLLSQRLA